MTLIDSQTRTQPQVEQKPAATPAQSKAEKPAKAQPKRVLEAKVEAQPKLQPLGEDDVASKSTEFLGNQKVRDTFSFAFSKGGPRYVKTVDFDFSDCTPEELLNLALKSARIDWQAKLRAAGEKSLDVQAFTKCNVKLDILSAERAVVDPKVRAVRGLMAELEINEAEAIAILEAARRNKK